MLESPSPTVGPVVPSAGVPALASLGLAPWLHASPRSARVMGSSTQFAWCALEDEVLMLASPDAVRFPNAILACGGWERLEPGERILIGSSGVVGRDLDWRIVRWWDSSVTPVEADPNEVMARASAIHLRRASPAQSALEVALASGDGAAVVDAAGGVLGAGRGLTPQGDDGLIGALAAYRHVSASLHHSDGPEMIDSLADQLLFVASRKTTLLSVTLIRHALAGEVPDPVADLMSALTGRGSVTIALERCLGLGDSSGRALAHGVLCGARAACEVAA